MTQWGCGLLQPVAPRTARTNATAIKAGIIQFDCGTALILLRKLLFVFITLSFLFLELLILD